MHSSYVSVGAIDDCGLGRWKEFHPLDGICLFDNERIRRAGAAAVVSARYGNAPTWPSSSLKLFVDMIRRVMPVVLFYRIPASSVVSDVDRQVPIFIYASVGFLETRRIGRNLGASISDTERASKMTG
ncbi:hypothetical protein [Marinobacter zhanjiangensis]|uniref:hypothetical protein n=1 Tax=Marinobacter zhanjiangensis TaxID=578215 RepID=UPI00167923D7|nr:hypothetical protein [Marinobacter zhanjiangensis]